MLLKTLGVVLTHYKYGEGSLVVHIFTQQLGMRSYLVQGVWRKKSTLRAALFQPLSMLSLEVYNRPGTQLQRIREASLWMPTNDILARVEKSSIAFFWAELLHKTLRIEVADDALFAFVVQQIEALEQAKPPLAMLPISFLHALSGALGIGPQVPKGVQAGYFDQLSGRFEPQAPLHAFGLSAEDSALFVRSLRSDYHGLTAPQRQTLTELWLAYFQLHFDTLGRLKSLEVLHEVFRT